MAGIVHRLDKGTSGLLVVAKTDDAYSKLIKQIMDRKFARKYIAIVEGVIEENDGIIDAPIGRSTSDRKRLAVTSGKSKIAITKFKVLERFAEHTLLEVELQTGRTHQIRVHMSYLNHPVFGDITYGNPHISLKHQALHA